jgi:anti-sigma regulatory factor (Ser/Thr protein kinase)
VRWFLPHRLEAPAMARRNVLPVLKNLRLEDEEIDTVLIVVSELVANAVRHARPPVRLRLKNLCSWLTGCWV